MTTKNISAQSPRHFASDNWAGAPQEIITAISQANQGHAQAYGNDQATARCQEVFRAHFGKDTRTFFVGNGTAANVLGLSALVKPHQAVLCSSVAHIQVDECGAVEKWTGARLIAAPEQNGRITPDQLTVFLNAKGNPHQSQPAVVSITQATERGTVYSFDEIRALADFAHGNGLSLHMDGARLANAAAALDLSLARMTRDAGVDVLSFGGTKNGILYGEAVVFFNERLASDFEWIRKQGLHLTSKMRFIAAQYDALLGTDLWLRNARYANGMAALLAQELRTIPEVAIHYPADINMVFCVFPKKAVPAIQKAFYFHIEDTETRLARLVTAFDTTRENVMDFIQVVRESI